MIAREPSRKIFADCLNVFVSSARGRQSTKGRIVIAITLAANTREACLKYVVLRNALRSPSQNIAAAATLRFVPGRCARKRVIERKLVCCRVIPTTNAPALCFCRILYWCVSSHMIIPEDSSKKSNAGYLARRFSSKGSPPPPASRRVCMVLQHGAAVSIGLQRKL